MRTRWAALVLVPSLLVATPAQAGKKECAEAYVEAQKHMKSGSLRAARDQALLCAKDECLAAVKRDCVAWLDEVKASIPSIVVAARGPDGRETTEVRLFIDGELVSEKLDVKAIDLEPGTRKLRFEMAGQAPIEREVILRQGEKNKLIEANFAPSETEAASRANAAVSPVPPPEQPRTDATPFIFVGVAGLALAGAGVFWFRAESGRSTLEDSRCAPACLNEDVSAIKTERIVGDVLLGVAIVSAAVAVYFFVAPRTPSRAARGQ